jgi:TPR repeat protein
MADKKEMKKLKKLAKKGDPTAQWGLGRIYEESTDLMDFGKAAELYRLAAEQGDSFGQL